MHGFPHIPRAARGPILLGSLLVLLLFWRSPPPRPLLAPPAAVGGASAPPERSLPPGIPTPTAEPLAGRFLIRDQLQMAVADGLYSDTERERLAVDLERALGYVAGRFGGGPRERIIASVVIDAGCGLHGIAYTDIRTTQVFTCPGVPQARVVNIMAHEFVHQLAHDRYGERHLKADVILVEGVATWGAGSYWLGQQADFRGFVRGIARETALLPLATSYTGRSISDMNTLYYQWASFVEFLLTAYGRERFDALYVSGSSAPGSADYYGTYGKSLPQLEAEWIAWLK
jgi:hypothetical protein